MEPTDLLDAYGRPFDPRPLVAAWEAAPSEGVADELWERLYHQGDIGTASYAAVPPLVAALAQAGQPDWNGYALIASVEEARLSARQSVPPSLADSYQAAWEEVLPLALKHLADATEDALVRSLLAVVAFAKGQPRLGSIALCTEDERREMLGEG